MVESKSRPQKIKVVDDILRTIRISGARFAKIDASTKRWYELNDVQAHQKIGHAIRDTIRLNGKHAAKKSENKPNSQALAAIRQARTVRRQQQEAERIQLGRRSSLESVLSTSLEADDFFMVQRELEQIRRYSKDKYDRPDEMASIYQYPTSIDAAVDGFRAVSNESAPPAPVATITPTTSSNSWQRLLQAQREVVDSFSTMSSQNKTSTLRRRISSMIRSVPAGRVSC